MVALISKFRLIQKGLIKLNKKESHMIGILSLVLSYKFILGFLVGASGLLIYLTLIGNKITFKKVKK